MLQRTAPTKSKRELRLSIQFVIDASKEFSKLLYQSVLPWSNRNLDLFIGLWYDTTAI
jgi:hypothetical protein